MTATETKSDALVVEGTSSQVGLGTWAILLVLFSLLFLTVLVAYLGWTFAGDADVPSAGYFAMALGVVLSLAVGFGLMALVFYSSRRGYDEPPVLIVRGDGDEIADDPIGPKEGLER